MERGHGRALSFVTAVLAGAAAVLSAVAALGALLEAWERRQEVPVASVSVRDLADAECETTLRASTERLANDGRCAEAVAALEALSGSRDLRLEEETAREALARSLWEEACGRDSGPELRGALCRRIERGSVYRGRTCCGAYVTDGPAAPGEGSPGRPEADGWYSAGSEPVAPAGPTEADPARPGARR